VALSARGFPREIPLGLGRHPELLYDPARGHELYNPYLDQLEFAEWVGFDGIGVNEHHANVYGLMPYRKLQTEQTIVAPAASKASAARVVCYGDAVRFRRNPVVAGRPGEGPFTIRFADIPHSVFPTGGLLSSRPSMTSTLLLKI